MKDEAVRSDHALGQVTGGQNALWHNRVRPPKRWEGQEVSGSDRRAEVSETSGGAVGAKSMPGLEPRPYGIRTVELGKCPQSPERW